MTLTRRQTVFIEEYLNCWNAAEAARRAGYSAKTARSQGERLLTDVDVAPELERRISERCVKPPEVLDRLADQARANMADFVSLDPATGRAQIDLAKAEKAGKLHLIKKISHGRNGLQIELYDAQAALEKLGKALGVLRENVNLSQEGPVEITTRVIRKRTDEANT